MSDPSPRPNRTRRRVLLAGLAALIPIIPIVVALSLSGGGAAAPATATASGGHFTPVGPAPKPRPAALTLPSGTGALVALVPRATQMRVRPGGRVLARVPARTSFGSPQAMWVRRVQGPWLGVVSVLAGNNRLGWIRASDASLSRVPWVLKVSLSARTLTVVDNGHAVGRFTVAIGAPASPTPTGHFAVTDRLNTGDPTGPYGCCVLALSAVAPHTIQGWDGGDRIAIHSTPETSSIGEAVSHGCVRLTLAEGRWLLAHIPLGTPTLISS